MLVFACLHEQCHFVHERSVFLAAVGIVNEKELLHIRRKLNNAAQLALRSRSFFVLMLMRTPSALKISSTFSQ